MEYINWFLKIKKRIFFINIYFLICLIIFFNSVAYSKSTLSMIKDIKIEGLKHAKESIVRDKISIKKKKIFSEEMINTDIKAILSLNMFEDVTVDKEEIKDGVIITYIVKENPWWTRLNFKGNINFTDKKLKNVSDLKIPDFFSKSKIEEGKQKIIDFYMNNSYTDFQIDSFYDFAPDKNEVTCDIYMIEGNKILINKVNIFGTLFFKEKKIVKLMETKRKKSYKDDIFKNDMEKIKEFYKNNGFFDFEIKDNKVIYNKERTKINIDIVISEGKQYRIGKIDFIGNSVYPSEELRKVINLKSGKIYSQESYELAVMNLQEKYSEKGYIKVQIEPEMKRSETGLINIILKITENDIYYVGDIYVEGNEITKDYVILREILIKQNDPFDILKIKKTNEKLYNLGFFEDVKIDFAESRTEKNTVDLTFLVTEQRTGMASAGAGYSNQDGLVGTLQISQNNMFGKGQKLNFMWEFGEKKQSYSISLTDPWPRFMRTRTSFGVDIYNLLRKRDYIYKNASNNDINNTYDEERQGGGLRLGRTLKKDILNYHLIIILKE